MPIISCDFCQKNFYKKPSQIRRSIKNFCSPLCQRTARKSGVVVVCFGCKKEVYKTKKSLERSQSKKFFCSVQCSNAWHGKKYFQEKHPNWKTGKYSYKSLMMSTVRPQKCVICGIDNIKLLVVHHNNRDRQNNKLKNLTWLCYNCHFLVHHYAEEKSKLSKIINANH